MRSDHDWVNRGPPRGGIDVHSHLFPIGLPDFAERLGGRPWPTLVQQDRGTAAIVENGEVYRRIDASYWDVEPRLSWMDESRHWTTGGLPLPVLSYWLGVLALLLAILAMRPRTLVRPR